LRSRCRTGLLVVAVFVIAIGGFVAYVMQPVCVPLNDEDLKSFNVPIEQREDRDFYLKVFQKRDGQWCQCKTRLSRAFFF
jgi:hypothetical protein